MTGEDVMRLAVAVFHGLLMVMAAIYGGVSWANGSPVTAELYGPAVYAVPALVWAGGQIGGAVLSILGALIWGRVGMFVMAFGGVLSLAFYGALAALSSYTAQGLIAQAGALGVGAPGAAITTILALGAARYGRQ